MSRNSGALWRLSITTTPEAEDAISELVGKLFEVPASSYTDAVTRKATVSVYLREPAKLNRTRALAADAISSVRVSGLEVGPGRISVVKVRREDWAESWKRHFKPMEIGSALVIRPSWSRRRPRQGQKVVVLDPGLSFGTGQHPTTVFCLRELVRRRSATEPQSFLHIGCGSGIWAISAAKIGYSPVFAFDHDSEAVRIALANALRNRLKARESGKDEKRPKPAWATTGRGRTEKLFWFRRQDVRALPLRPPMKHPIICANLTADLLLTERDRILAQLQSGGMLVLAGILRVEFGKVRSEYEAAGMRLMASNTRREWRSGSFCAKFI